MGVEKIGLDCFLECFHVESSNESGQGIECDRGALGFIDNSYEDRIS